MASAHLEMNLFKTQSFCLVAILPIYVCIQESFYEKEWHFSENHV